MAIEQKRVSLYCGLPAGLNFIAMDDISVLPLVHVPFELQLIIGNWINALPESKKDENPETEIVRDHPKHGLSLTEVGWSAFVTWMLRTLEKEQSQASYAPDLGARI